MKKIGDLSNSGPPRDAGEPRVAKLHGFLDTGQRDPVYIDAALVANWLLKEGIENITIEPFTFVSPFPYAIFKYSWKRFNIQKNLEVWVICIQASDEFKDGVEKDIDEWYFDKETKWWLDFVIFDTGPSAFLGEVVFECDETGEFLPGSYTQWTYANQEAIEATTKEDRQDLFNEILYPAWMAISLMHCKNIELVDRKLSRQYKRKCKRKGIQPIVWKTLVVEPFKKQVISETGLNESGIKKALHICRGHFATYGEDKPLFGKYAGTFWKPAHVRGSTQYGKVQKDYQISTDGNGDENGEKETS